MANFIQGAIKRPGALHKKLGVPQGQKIPAKKLNAAASKGGLLGKEANFAKELKGFGHKKQTTTPVKTDRGSFGIKG